MKELEVEQALDRFATILERHRARLEVQDWVIAMSLHWSTRDPAARTVWLADLDRKMDDIRQADTAYGPEEAQGRAGRQEAFDLYAEYRRAIVQP